MCLEITSEIGLKNTKLKDFAIRLFVGVIGAALMMLVGEPLLAGLSHEEAVIIVRYAGYLAVISTVLVISLQIVGVILILPEPPPI
jgi:hypothetical protein